MEWQIQQCLIGAMTIWNGNSARKGEKVGYTVPGTVILQGTAWLVQGSLLSLWLTAAAVWHFCSFVISFLQGDIFCKNKKAFGHNWLVCLERQRRKNIIRVKNSKAQLLHLAQLILLLYSALLIVGNRRVAITLCFDLSPSVESKVKWCLRKISADARISNMMH